MCKLDDEESPKSIREYVRNHSDLDVYEYIQRGYNGEVYFAKRKKLGDHVVLKFYGSDENFNSKEEAVILQKIDHPNVLKVYNAEFVPPISAVFVTPKIPGGDLQNIIDTSPVSTKDALNFVAGILKGITELHSQHNLVHRDLKPGNILISAENESIIADLGSVKKLSAANNYTTTSKATTLYLPPESIIEKEYYFQSDLYQIGLILYQLVGGHFPVNEPLEFLTERELKKLESLKGSAWSMAYNDFIEKKITNGKLADRSKLPTYLPSKFKRILNKALHKDYDSRYANSADFLGDVYLLRRSTPNITKNRNHLLFEFENGISFRVSRNAKGENILEKKKDGGSWRQHKQGHDGSLLSMYQFLHAL
ncbi:MAG: serine/threonine protein kinase [Bacteroidia bacterium]